MATKKSTTKKVATKKATVGKKSAAAKRAEISSIYTTNVSIVFAMAVEALILLLGYLIIMSVA